MRKLFIVMIPVFFIASACSKTINDKPARSAINEPPVIKVITPTSVQVLKQYDQLTVKAMITDIDLVAVASWEAVNAAGACGSNPYKGSYTPMTSEYELNFSFTIPTSFEGDHVIRIYGVDASGNIATADITYKTTN